MHMCLDLRIYIYIYTYNMLVGLSIGLAWWGDV